MTPDRVLITGGSGFLGTNLVGYYRAQGAAVLNLDIAAPRNVEHDDVWRCVDILDRERLLDAVRKFRPTHVLHMAARTDLGGRSVTDYAANVQGVANVIDAVSAADSVRRVGFSSSMLVCALGYRPNGPDDYCPTTPYGMSKVEGERLVRRAVARDYGWVILRPTSIWGPWFGAPYRGFFEAVARRLYVHPRGRKTLRSYGFVGNAVHQIDGMLRAPEEQVDGKVFYVCDYEPLEIEEWGHEIAAVFGVRPPRRVPLALLEAAAWAGDIAKKCGASRVPLTRFRLRNLLTSAVFDQGAVRAVVGDCPYTRIEGVRETVRWMRSSVGRVECD